MLERKKVIAFGVPGEPWLYDAVAPEQEEGGLGNTVVGEPIGVVADAGVAVGVVQATPREQVVAEGTVWYG